MKKMCNKVLAMLLTIVMVFLALPLNAFAWFDVEGETTQSGNATASDVTVTIDPKELLSYIKDRDVAGLIEAIAVSGLREIVSLDELYEIIPKEDFVAIADAIKEDIDLDSLLAAINFQKILETADREALIDLVLGVENLENYLDYEGLVDYVDEDDIEAAIEYIDTEKLVNDYSTQLIDLALELSEEELAEIVDLEAALDLPYVDYVELIDTYYFKSIIGYHKLLGVGEYEGAGYIDRDALHNFIVTHYADGNGVRGWTAEWVHSFVDDEALIALLTSRDPEDLVKYVDFSNLQKLIDSRDDINYDTLKADGYLNEALLIDLLQNSEYASFEGYLTDKAATEARFEDALIASGADLSEFYVNGALSLEKMLKAPAVEGVYSDMIAAGELDVNAMLFAADSAYNVEALLEADIIDAKKVVSGNKRLFTVSELEHADVIDYQLIAFGGVNDKDEELPALISLIDLLDNRVFDLSQMLEGNASYPALFTVNELVKEEIVSTDALLKDYTYAQLFRIDLLEDRLFELIHADENAEEKLSTRQVIDCLKKDANGNIDYASAIRAIGGVKAAVDRIDGLTYVVILDDYVSDFDGLLKAIKIETIIDRIINDNKVEDVLDVKGLITAIGLRDLIGALDIKTVIRELADKELLVDVLKSLTPEKYINCLSRLLNTFMANVLEIRINGVVVTESPVAGVLQFNTEALLASIQVIVPTMEDLANMDDNGEFLAFSFGITYKSDATNGVVKSKDINLSVRLGSGVDQVRKAAAKVSALLDKVISYNYNNGNLTVNLKVPSEFARVIRFILTHLGTDADPELVALKDELLGLYDANLSDAANFVDNVTLGQVVTILEKVDPAIFEKAYNTILKQTYVELMLDYIGRVTDNDLSDVSIETLMNKLANLPALPTVEEIAQKVEELTGRDLVSKLPDRAENALETVGGKSVTDIVNALAAKAGVDFDLQAILTEAAKQDDPIAYLYNTIVEKLENSSYAYAAVQYRIEKVVDKLLASSVGVKLNSVRLNELYSGNGTFGWGEDVFFSPKKQVQNAIDKLVDRVIGDREINTAYVDEALSIVYALFTDSQVSIGLDVSATFKGVYKASFYTEKGVFLGAYFLPQDMKLDLVQTYEGTADAPFLGWQEMGAGTETYFTVMPKRDIKLVADIEGYVRPDEPDYEYTVTFVDKNNSDNTFDVKVKNGMSVLDVTTLEELYSTIGYNPTDARETLTFALADGTEYALDTAVTADLTVYFEHKVVRTVTVVNPDDGSVYGSVTLLKGESLSANAEFQALEAALKTELAFDSDHDALAWLLVAEDGAKVDYIIGNPVDEDITLTWSVTTTYTVTFVDANDADTKYTYSVLKGKTLSDDQIADLYKEIGYDLNDKHEELVLLADNAAFDLTAAVNGDITVTYEIKYYQFVSVYSAGVLSQTIKVEKNTALSANAEFIALQAHIMEVYAGYGIEWDDEHQTMIWYRDNLPYDTTLAVTEDFDLTWECKTEYTVTIVNPATGEVEKTIVLHIDENAKLSLDDEFDAFRLEIWNTCDKVHDELLWYKATVEDGTVTIGDYWDPAEDVTGDITLTWKVDTYYTVNVNVFDQDHETLLFRLKDNKFLSGTDYETITNALDSLIIANDAYPKLEKWEDALYSRWIHVWALDADTLVEDVELNVYIEPDRSDTSLKLEGADVLEHYDFEFKDNTLYVHWNEPAWVEKMDLVIGRAFLEYAIDPEHRSSIVLDSEDDQNGHRVALSPEVLDLLVAKMDEFGDNTVTLSYAETPTEDKKYQDSVEFSFSFYFGESDTAEGMIFGDASVEIRMPFNGKGYEKEKTYLYIDSQEWYFGKEGADAVMSISGGNVVIYAPHFSDFTLVNKYYLSYTDPKWVDVDTALLGDDMANVSEIVNQAISVGFYAYGEKVTLNGKFDILSDIDGVNLQAIRVLNKDGAWLWRESVDLTSATFTAPGYEAFLQPVVTAETYYIYYYVGGELVESKTFPYTRFEIPKRLSILSTKDMGEEGTWFIANANADAGDDEYKTFWGTLGTAPQDLHLFYLTVSPEQAFEVNFVFDEENVLPIPNNVKTWLNGELATLNSKVDAWIAENNLRDADDTRVLTWKDANGKDLNAYTYADWVALMESGETSVVFTATFEARKYNVTTDGNLTLNTGALVAQGTKVTFTVIEQVGKDAKVWKTVNGVREELTENFFEMPDADVILEVVYTTSKRTYVDVNGNAIEELYGTTLSVDIIIPAGKTLNTDVDLVKLAVAPAGLALVNYYENEDGAIVMTYAFTLTEEGCDLKAFVEAVNRYIVDKDYDEKYILNGVAYPSKQAAEAAAPEDIVIKDWKKISDNMYFAVVEFVGEESPAALIVLIVVLALLILILLIALFYTLYITGKWAPNWFLKAITAIVTAFFKVCMAVAAVGVRIARFFGYQEKDLVEDEVAEEEAPVAEATEEVAEEATEEVTEEAAEEATEEVTEEATEEVTEEATEEATEEETEETTEENSEES